MMVRDVVPAPQGRHCRHRQHQPTARRELGPERDQRTLVVGDMLEHVEEHDQIVMSVLQRDVGKISTPHLDAGAPRGEGARMVVGFDRVDRTELLEHRDVGARAAADFEDPEQPLFGPPALEQGGQNPAAADEPPMIAVDLRHPVIDMAFHQASSSPASPIVSRTM